VTVNQENGEPAPRVRPRRRWVLAVLIVLVTLAGASVGVLHSPWMSVHEIEIVGADRADVAGRLAGAGIGTGAIMIWLDTAEVEEAVAADPWVRAVRADRVFPDRLIVEVLEHTPVAWLEGTASWMLVSRDGSILEVAEASGPGLLAAEAGLPDGRAGDRPEDLQWSEFVGLALTLSPEVAGDLRVFFEGGELWIEGRGLRARLGRATALAEKGAVFEAMLAEGFPIGTMIDLVAPGRPAVIYPTDGGRLSTGEGSG
jgi:hypothetical protein